MEKEQLHKTIGSSRRTKPRKGNAAKRLPLALSQLQNHAVTPNLLAGEVKRRGKVKQVPKAVSQENVSCQTESIDKLMCTAEHPPSEYWEIMAERREVALAESVKENNELHKEVQKLKEKAKTLQHKNKDAEYFAMMYHIIRSADT